MITIRIPTQHSFAYIEEDYTGDDIKGRYNELYALMNDTPNTDTFYNYLINLANSDMTKWGDVNYYESLSAKEKEVVQAFKRFTKRLPKE